MRLFLLFLTVPLIEIALFVQVGGMIGLFWTLLIVVATAILGTILVRSQGIVVLNRLRETLNEVKDPTEPLVHGAMILFSGALLLTPGFFTDAVGFALLVPQIRAALYSRLRSRLVVHSEVRGSADRSAEDEPIDVDYEVVQSNDEIKRPSGWTRH